jgi:hypothetical protein
LLRILDQDALRAQEHDIVGDRQRDGFASNQLFNLDGRNIDKNPW